MKILIEILYWVLFLILLLVFIMLLGGIIFNVCNPHVKGMGRMDFELLGVIIISIYGLFSFFRFLKKSFNVV